MPFLWSLETQCSDDGCVYKSKIKARTSRPPSDSSASQVLGLSVGFARPQGRNPSAGLAPQAPFRKVWAPVTCAIVLGIVLESYGVFALGGPS